MISSGLSIPIQLYWFAFKKRNLGKRTFQSFQFVKAQAGNQQLSASWQKHQTVFVCVNIHDLELSGPAWSKEDEHIYIFSFYCIFKSIMYFFIKPVGHYL